MTPLAVNTTKAGELLGVSRWTVQRFVREGRLARIPGTQLFAVAELERFASSGSTPSASVTPLRGVS